MRGKIQFGISPSSVPQTFPLLVVVGFLPFPFINEPFWTYVCNVWGLVQYSQMTRGTIQDNHNVNMAMVQKLQFGHCFLCVRLLCNTIQVLLDIVDPFAQSGIIRLYVCMYVSVCVSSHLTNNVNYARAFIIGTKCVRDE